MSFVACHLLPVVRHPFPLTLSCCLQLVSRDTQCRLHLASSPFLFETEVSIVRMVW